MKRRSAYVALFLPLALGACASGPAIPPAPAPAAHPATLRIIATNDFHGAFEPRMDGGRRLGGAPQLATAIARARAECAPTCVDLLLDGGDMFQGTPASNLAFGRPVVDLYNALGYAAAALGNHEFDWGQDTLRARMRQAHHAILAANVRYADGREVPWIRPDTIVTRGGARIGIIGVATTATPLTTRSQNVADLRFLDPAPAVDARARALRARGATLVVVVAHAGAFCSRDGATDCAGEIVDLANGLREKVDAIISGHTHSLVATRVRGIPIVQARSSGRAIAVIDIPLRESGATRLEVRPVVSDSLPPDPAAAGIARAAIDAVAPLVNKPIAEIAEPLRRTEGQHALGNLIADAMRAAGGADAAIMNNGGIRADLPAGTATYGRLFEVQPFGNVLFRITLTGAQLRDYLERVVLTERRGQPNVHVSGVRIRYDVARPAGQRIVSLVLTDGTEPKPDGRYTIVINDFMLGGGDGLAPPAGAPAAALVQDLDALIAFLRSQPQPVRGDGAARIGRVAP